MLVVVHDGDVELGLESALDFKRLGRLDVLKVDAAERGRDGLHRGYESIWIRGIHFNVKNVDVRKDFEKDALSLHDGLGSLGTDVAEPEDRGAIGNHRHQVAFRCVAVDILRSIGNGKTRRCNPRAVGQRQVALGTVRLGRQDFNLALATALVVLQRLLFIRWIHAGAKVRKVSGPNKCRPQWATMIFEVATSPAWRIAPMYAPSARSAVPSHITPEPPLRGTSFTRAPSMLRSSKTA